MKIAGYTVRFSVRYSLLEKLGAPFLCAEEHPDFIISPTEADIALERERSEGQPTRESALEALACYRKLAEKIYPDNAFVVHGAAVCTDGQGVIFMAPSGTGKTTHLRLWQTLLGDGMTVINGDKPIVKLTDGKPVVYGTPFKGKEQYGCNAAAPLRHLCLISRSEENRTEVLSQREAVALLLRQTHIPETGDAMQQAMGFFSVLLQNCRFWKICCNMDLQAAEVSYKTIFEK